MKTDWTHLEPYRVTKDDFFATNPGQLRGLFRIPNRADLNTSWHFVVIASSDSALTGWEHVSAHARRIGGRGKPSDMRTPSWDEMSYIKSLFWHDSETVMQLHVPASEHINTHPHVLHLWKPSAETIPTPPSFLV